MSDISGELIERVVQARQQGQKLALCGGNSKTFMGREASGEPLAAGSHCGIVSYQPVELVMTARGGTTVQEITETLAEQGQVLACEPPSFNGQATIAGTLACNLSGPARPWAGSFRDAVLGVQLINGLGQQLNFGGQVMKNVAGYDVSRMQAGGMGTLGIITQVSFKVMPKPAAQCTLVAPMNAEQAIETMNRLAATPKPLTGACWLDDKLYLRLAGAASAVAGTVLQWPGQAMDAQQGDNFWSAVKEQQSLFFASKTALWRFSVRPTAAHFLPEAPWSIDWGGGQRWLKGEYDRAELERFAEASGGQVALYRGGDRRGEVFHSQPAAVKVLQKRLKAALDPEGIFNPGRLYSWL
ncbi:MAG: glycolate oxidase FAD binding subunit [Paraglaciecola psychrophila]|jgi:glycolate oxidase FAD binding subunit